MFVVNRQPSLYIVLMFFDKRMVQRMERACGWTQLDLFSARIAKPGVLE